MASIHWFRSMTLDARKMYGLEDSVAWLVVKGAFLAPRRLETEGSAYCPRAIETASTYAELPKPPTERPQMPQLQQRPPLFVNGYRDLSVMQRLAANT